MAFTTAATVVGAATGATMLGTLGAVIGAGGKVFSGVMEKQAAYYDAKVQAMNARLAEEEALRESERAQMEQLSKDNENAAMLGGQLAAQGASGLAVTGRSSVLTRKSARRLARQDALNIREAGDLGVYNLRSEAANLRAQSKVSKRAGKAALFSSILDAGSSLISGASPMRRSSLFTPRSTSVRTN